MRDDNWNAARFSTRNTTLRAYIRCTRYKKPGPEQPRPAETQRACRTAKSSQHDRQPARRIFQCAAPNQTITHTRFAFFNATKINTWDIHQSVVKRQSLTQLPRPAELGGRNDTCMTDSMDGRTHPDRNRSRGQIVTSDAPSVIQPAYGPTVGPGGQNNSDNPNPHPEPLGYNPPPPHKTSREGKLKKIGPRTPLARDISCNAISVPTAKPSCG